MPPPFDSRSPSAPLAPLADGPSHRSAPRHPLLGKTSATLGVMLAALAIPYASPKLAKLRVLSAPWGAPAAEEAGDPQAPDAPSLGVGETALKASSNEATITNALPSAASAPPDPAVLAKARGSLAVEDPTGHALDGFYATLTHTARGETSAITRVLHYGDSVITSDYVSGTMRRRMQARFGDAGHGFILIANPWEWYFHNDVTHSASEGWSAHTIVGPLAGDGMYGLGGVSFHTTGAASAFFSTVEHADYGLRASRFDVYYLEQPGGGDVQVVVPGRAAERFSTRGPKKVSRIFPVKIADGKAQLSLRTVGNGDARLFGVVMERDEPGVTYDALGSNGARARLLAAMDDEHWAEQMALRKPSLVVLQYGTNESEDAFNAERYERSLGVVLDKLKAAAPMASLLVASPLDRAERGEGGALRTKSVIVKLVEAQRRVALAHGVAFWNAFEAMGGKGAFARWLKASPPLASWDLIHPTPAGAEIVGDLFFKALMAGFESYEAARR